MQGASPAFFPEADFVQGGEKISFRKQIRVKTTAFKSSPAERGFFGRKMRNPTCLSLRLLLPWGSAFIREAHDG